MIKNAILIVDFANQLKQEGKDSRKAVIEAGIARFRPILMTTIAMVIAMIPIAFATGAGAEWKNGLAIVLMGGLTSSLIFTIVLVPVMFVVVDTLKDRWGSKKKSAEPRATEKNRKRYPPRGGRGALKRLGYDPVRPTDTNHSPAFHPHHQVYFNLFAMSFTTIITRLLLYTALFIGIYAAMAYDALSANFGESSLTEYAQEALLVLIALISFYSARQYAAYRALAISLGVMALVSLIREFNNYAYEYLFPYAWQVGVLLVLLPFLVFLYRNFRRLLLEITSTANSYFFPILLIVYIPE